MSSTLFRNVRILDCTGAPPFEGCVRVEGNRIAAVVPAPAVPAAADARIVEGRGATLMPGLIEAHSHLTFTDVAQSVELGFIPPEEHMLRPRETRGACSMPGLPVASARRRPNRAWTSFCAMRSIRAISPARGPWRRDRK